MLGKLKLLALAAATSFSVAAHADLWNFSYTFNYTNPEGAHDVVTGSFTGDESGDHITNLADARVYLNGQLLLGEGSFILNPRQLDSYGDMLPAVASANLRLNNFLFTEFANYSGRGFAIYNDDDFFDRDVEVWPKGGRNDFGDLPGLQENWILTRASIPEPATSLLSLAGLLGLGWSRSRRQS